MFSHHTERTTRLPSDDPGEQPIHYGERLDRKSTPPRPVRPDGTPGTTLEDLFCRHDNVLAHIDGHEHENYVLQHRCEAREATALAVASAVAEADTIRRRMNFDFTDEQQSIRRLVRDFAQNEVKPVAE